jgi:hypothetical protein
LEELTQNVLTSDQQYSAGCCKRGFQAEDAAGVNLTKVNRDWDDYRYGELTQLKTTTRVTSRQALLQIIRNDAENYGAKRAPYVVQCRDGTIRTLQEADVPNGKNLLYLIPDEALNFSQQELLPALEQIEESNGIRIAVQAVSGLRGEP